LAHCWALRNQAPARVIRVVGWVGLLVLDFWIVDASIARTAAPALGWLLLVVTGSGLSVFGGVVFVWVFVFVVCVFAE
jgi:hypothetical protein